MVHCKAKGGGGRCLRAHRVVDDRGHHARAPTSALNLRSSRLIPLKEASNQDVDEALHVELHSIWSGVARCGAEAFVAACHTTAPPPPPPAVLPLLQRSNYPDLLHMHTVSIGIMHRELRLSHLLFVAALHYSIGDARSEKRRRLCMSLRC